MGNKDKRYKCKTRQDDYSNKFISIQFPLIQNEYNKRKIKTVKKNRHLVDRR